MVRRFLEEKGWEHKESGGRINLRTCPDCGDNKWHAYIDPAKAVYFCNKCGGGHLSKHGYRNELISQPFGKRRQGPKEDLNKLIQKHRLELGKRDCPVREYLRSRGLWREDGGGFGAMEKDGKWWLAIPSFEGGTCVNIKYRSVEGKEYFRTEGGKSVLFLGEEVLAKKPKEVILTEGELDAATLYLAGFPAIGVSNGAGGFNPEWIEQLAGVRKIYLCYDNDVPGRDGAEKVVKRLGRERCWLIALPDGIKDANELFVKSQTAADEFKACMASAKDFALPGVLTIAQACGKKVDEIRTRGKGNHGLLTPWPDLNKKIKGWRGGDLIILTAPPKIGKTTLALNICFELAKSGTPCLNYCMEMRPERIVEKLAQYEWRKNEPDEGEYLAMSMVYEDLPLYLGAPTGRLSPDEIIELIRSAVRKYGLGFVVFDNLHFMVRSLAHCNEEIGQMVQKFKLLAEEEDIPVMVIAQPRKRENVDEIMNAEDVKYSNAIHADCDQMVIMHRRRVQGGADGLAEEAYESETLVRVDAHRYGPGGETGLYFRGECSRFESIAPSSMNSYFTGAKNVRKDSDYRKGRERSRGAVHGEGDADRELQRGDGAPPWWREKDDHVVPDRELRQARGDHRSVRSEGVPHSGRGVDSGTGVDGQGGDHEKNVGARSGGDDPLGVEE